MLSADIIYILIIAVVAASSVAEFFLSRLNHSHAGRPIPSLLEGIYDDEKYRKQQAYTAINYRFSTLQSFCMLAIIMLMLFTGGFGFLGVVVENISNNLIIQAIIFFFMLALASDIIGIPFEIYDTFVIEEKFGFNNTTIKTYIVDKIKTWLLSAIVGGGLLALITWIYYQTPEYFWLLACLVFVAFSIMMNLLYSDLIVPLFNKQKPLEEGELKQSIEDLASKAGFSIKRIMVIDGSKRSTRANAYFSGLGPRKRVVFYDTLLNTLSHNEVLAVLAHEIGHYRKRHIVAGMVISTISMAITLYIMSLFLRLPVFSEALGFSNASFHSGLLVFAFVYTPVSAVLSVLSNIVSRRNEFSADEWASRLRPAGHLISALKKLASLNMVNLTPHPLYVFFSYSHPPLLQRIETLLHNDAKNKEK